MPFDQKIVAIHQPNYFPWLGFFYKIYACDVFVFHDNVEHSKRYPTRRTRIRKSNEDDSPIWLTVPLKKHSDFALIKDLEVDHFQDWQGKHLHKFSNSYSSAPFFQQIFPKIEICLAGTKHFNSLAEMNVFLIENILGWLEIEREIQRSSKLLVEGKGSEYNVELVKFLGGTTYLSGQGGSNYQSDSLFEQAGISLVYSDWGGKLENLKLPFSSRFSILEVLVEVGFERLTCFFDELISNAP